MVRPLSGNVIKVLLACGLTYGLPTQVTAASQLAPFDDELYTVAYNTFLANRNTKDAVMIAKAAVKQRPNNVVWRRRLAIVAGWNRQPKLAFQQWYQIALQQQSLEAINQALSLAKQLNDTQHEIELLRLKVKKYPADASGLKGLVAAEEKLGHPHRALALLEQHQRLQPNHSNLVALAKLHQQLGDSDKESQLVEGISSTQPDFYWAAMRQAELLYNQGELKKALVVLQKQHVAANQHPKYWRTLAQLAWVLNDHSTARRAYTALYFHHKVNQSDYLRLVQLSRKVDPAFAFVCAERGWQRYHHIDLLLAAMDLGVELKRWQSLNLMLTNVTSAQRSQLMNNVYYWEVRAVVADKLGDPERAQDYFQAAIARYPQHLPLRAAYLWFLLDRDDQAELNRTLSLWQNQLLQHTTLRQVYAYALLRVGLKPLAAALVARDYPRFNRSLIWLNEFAQMLDEANNPRLAFLLRQRAWQGARHYPHIRTARYARSFAELAIRQDQGNTALPAIEENRRFAKRDYHELLNSWAIASQSYDLAAFVRDRMYSSSDQSPAWADLSLALQRYERQRLQTLLTHKVSQLPHRDRVTAAQDLNDLTKAEELAILGLNQHQRDGLLYEQLIDLMEVHAHKVSTGVDYERFGELKGPRPYWNLRYFVSPGNVLEIDSSWWRLGNRDISQIRALPAASTKVGVGWRHLVERGYSKISVVYYRWLRRFVSYQWQGLFRVSQRLTLTPEIQYNAVTDDSARLRVAGLQDRLQLDSSYRLNRKQVITSSVMINTLRDQSRTTLAHSYQLYLSIEHKLRATYPDFSLRVFGSLYSYHWARPFTTSLLDTIIPGAGPNGIDGVIPKSFQQYGISFQVGEYYWTHYSRQWRPFAVATVFENTLSGFGYYAVVGIAGRVSGHDHLALYYQRSDGENAQNTTTRQRSNDMVGIRYSHYFSVS